MFLYVDDLISEEARDTRLQHDKVKPKLWRSTGHNRDNAVQADENYGLHESENIFMYDNDTGRRIEIERVEEEYVEVWDHGKWVRGALLTSARARQFTQPTSTQAHGDRHSKSPNGHTRKKSEAHKKPTPDEEIILLDDDNNTKDIKLHNYMLGPSIPSSPSPTRKADEQQPVKNSIRNEVDEAQPIREGVGETGAVVPMPKGNEDFHFAAAQKEILPSTIHVPKLTIAPRAISTKSVLVYHKNIVLNPPAGKTPTTGQSHKPLQVRGQSNRPLQQPLLAGAHKPSRMSKRSVHYAQNGRRTRYPRQRYQEALHVNINAKPGSRINYVNINHRPNRNATTPNTKSPKLKWSSHRHPPQSSRQKRDVNKTNLYGNYSKSARTNQNPVIMQKTEVLSADSRLDLQDGISRHSFNVSASHSLPSLRQLPDTRPKR